ncbi:Asp-tRNA(Asn)/Glu-tRNA(Gln) amidotransferase subunit GatC [Gottschalkia acidurici]|nr:Asp-tRNA(Asn)/Glu-tRNA(Gln) amidotransferase subunit GatC [Gottschalkia acidurici]
MTKEDIKNLAQVAKLELNETELEEYYKDFNDLLKNIDKIKEIDLDKKIEDCNDRFNNSGNMEEFLREDKVLESMKREDILSNTIDVENGYIKVLARKE